MNNLKKFWDLLNPKFKDNIKSFLKKMAVLLDIIFIFTGLINSMNAYLYGKHWIVGFSWLLFMLVFIAIAWVYIDPYL